MAVSTLQPELVDIKALPVNMATSTVSAALGDERTASGLELNG